MDNQPQFQQQYQPQAQPQTQPLSSKKKSTAALLCFFLGGFGAHRFYLGYTGMGILYLLTAGLFGIGALVDFIVILCGNMKDKEGYPLS